MFLNGSTQKEKKSKYIIKEKTFNKSKFNNINQELKLSHIIIGCSVLIISMVAFFPKAISSKESYASEDLTQISSYELNRHRLNMQTIISENSGVDRVKEQVTEDRDVDFETNYTENATLPKGEEILKQEGQLGKDSVKLVKTYESGNLIEEIILSKENILEPIPKLIDLGTSEFLAKHKVHLGDTMYLIKENTIKESPEDSAKDVAQLKKSIDVKLLELPNEDWCKVSFDNIEGYIKTSNLTSATTTPSIVESNRIQRILLKVNINMELNKSSGLTLNDYKKIFSNIPDDSNDVFKNNYAAFYNVDKKYNINGIFLASIAIHESGWGTSQIAREKYNLFGYGSYDSTPYSSSFEFSSYEDGIETVAKSLVKYYLNPAGTIIYNNEIADGSYYNSPTLPGVNIRYASDSSWNTKVYTYLESLYNRLQ